MPHIKVVIDGHTEMDANTERGRGMANLPPKFANCMQPGARPEPWMKAAMFAIAEAVTNGQDLALTVTTHTQGWTLAADNTPKHYQTRDDIWDPRNP